METSSTSRYSSDKVGNKTNKKRIDSYIAFSSAEWASFLLALIINTSVKCVYSITWRGKLGQGGRIGLEVMNKGSGEGRVGGFQL